MTESEPNNDEQRVRDESAVCQQCRAEIEGQPLYPSRDITMGEGGLEYAEDPDGPFCDVDCRAAYDEEGSD